MRLTLASRVVSTLCVALAVALGVHSDDADARPRKSPTSPPGNALGRSSGSGKSKPQGLVGTAGAGAVVKPLTLADKVALLEAAKVKGEPGTVYARVDGRTMVEPGRAGIVASVPLVVNPMAGHLAFARRTTGVASFAGLWIKSAHSGARYLVDCDVEVMQGQSTATFRAFDGGHTVATGHGGHLVWLLEASDNKWHDFKILTEDTPWTLAYCEITNL